MNLEKDLGTPREKSFYYKLGRDELRASLTAQVEALESPTEIMGTKWQSSENSPPKEDCKHYRGISEWEVEGSEDVLVETCWECGKVRVGRYQLIKTEWREPFPSPTIKKR